MTSELKAFIRMVTPNLISPVRATRRYGRQGEFDIELPLRTEQGMENYFSKHVGLAESIGNLIKLKKSADEFKIDIINIINKNENAQNGVFFLIKQEIETLHKQQHELAKILHDDKLKIILTPAVYEHTVSAIKDMWKTTFAEISKDLVWMADLELDISRHANRIRDFSVQLDYNMKSGFGHFDSRIRDDERAEKNEFKEVENLIIKHKDVKSLEAELRRDLKEFIKIIFDEMKLIMNELRNLTIIIRDMEEALMKVYSKHVEGKLEGEMKLPHETAQLIKKDFTDILAVIREKSQLYFQEAKLVAQKAAA